MATTLACDWTWRSLSLRCTKLLREPAPTPRPQKGRQKRIVYLRSAGQPPVAARPSNPKVPCPLLVRRESKAELGSWKKDLVIIAEWYQHAQIKGIKMEKAYTVWAPILASMDTWRQDTAVLGTLGLCAGPGPEESLLDSLVPRQVLGEEGRQVPFTDVISCSVLLVSQESLSCWKKAAIVFLVEDSLFKA
jgi:hypothetical protein